MPRKPIDYSNTIIYKLCCNDPSITDIYVGHTTNWTKRKQNHKYACNNENSKSYNIYVYQFIREHGNWDNWTMIELEKINCIDGNDARKHERRHFELLGATLNIETPSRTIKEWTEYNIEYLTEYRKNYQEDNKEKIQEYQNKYVKDHKEGIQEYNKKYYENNKKYLLEQVKNYREENKEILKEKRRLKNMELKLQKNT